MQRLLTTPKHYNRATFCNSVKFESAFLIKEDKLWETLHLLCAAVELAQDVEERDLWDNELLLLVLVQWSCWEVQCQKQEGGLRHLLLVLFCHKQCFFLLWWL